MPYISLDNLTQYNGRLRDYIDGSFDKLDGANWRKTSAGQSVSCFPIPESPLEPEVTFKFSETPPASGTKSPDNPSTIVGVEAVACHVCEAAGVNDTPYFIGLGDTYYGGTVNFATGVMEVTWGSRIFNSAENIYSSSDTYRNDTNAGIYIGSGAIPNVFSGGIASIVNSIACEKFGVVTESNFISGAESVYKSVGQSLMFRIDNSRLASYGYVYGTSTSGDCVYCFKQWITDNPVTIYYNLATPFTVSLTPVLVRSLPALSHYTPRQNTIYTPHESVQVGYAKSALKTSEDLANAIVALGGNV